MPRSLHLYSALLYLCDGRRTPSYLCFLVLMISMNPPTETNALLKNAEFTHMHEWQWVPSLKDPLQKHKTTNPRGYCREGLLNQDDSLGMRGLGDSLGSTALYQTLRAQGKGLGDAEGVNSTHPHQWMLSSLLRIAYYLLWREILGGQTQ